MEEQRKRRLWMLPVFLILLMVLVIYPLSIGPVAWLVTHYEASDGVMDFVGVFYTPLEMVAERLPKPIQSAVEWYIAYWVVE